MSQKLPHALQDDHPVVFNDGEKSTSSSEDRPVVSNEKAQNTLVMSYARDEWIRRKLVERESEFMEFRNLRIFCGTFNANGKSPSRISIARWLRGGDAQDNSTSTMQDCYICSFQEIVDLNAANVIAEGHSAKRTAQWADLIGETLNSMAGGTETKQGRGRGSTDSFEDSSMNFDESEDARGSSIGSSSSSNINSSSGTSTTSSTGAYRLVATKYLVGIALVAFIKAEHEPNVRNVQLQTAGVGIGGFVGNKGAAALRFTYGNSSICVVSSHLSAHRGAVASRNSDFHNILSKITFKDRVKDHSVHMVRDHDYVFWLGDLNYRIQTDISVEECYRRIRSNDLEYLRRNDQLNIERAAGRSFDHFNEGPLNFKPTYKYIPGEDRYDDRPDKKMRAPAWCDRVLWSCRAGNESEIVGSNGVRTKLVKLQKYQREDSIKISDHKPVFAIFEVQVKMIVRAEQKRVYEELMRGMCVFFSFFFGLYFFLYVFCPHSIYLSFITILVLFLISHL
jgi:inositol polyphosphate 5-phosphatase INPP5B/F